MKRFLSSLAKTFPFFQRKVFFFSLLYLIHNQNCTFPQIKCFTAPKVLRQTIDNLSRNIIDIYCEGRLVGSAYCFQQNYLVSVCPELQDDKFKAFQYYLGDQKLRGSFRVIGKFQNLTFIECTLTKQFVPLPKSNSSPLSYQQIEIVHKKQYMSLKKGHFITKDSGYGIIDAEGGIGGLVVQNGGVHGIIAQTGTQNALGFLRIIEWAKLSKLLQFATGRKIHLGISAQAHPRREGIEIVRIAPNSPFSRDVMMGDVILSANGHTFRDPESLYRICLQSDGPISLQLLRDGILMHLLVAV